MVFNWVESAIDNIDVSMQVILVTIIATRGSVPREVGTKMLVSPTQIKGTIGGGNFEYMIINQCRKMMIKGAINVCVQHYPLGPMTQQCCGGAVSVSLEPLTSQNLEFLNQVQASNLERKSGVIMSRLRGETNKTIEAKTGKVSGLFNVHGVQITGKTPSIKNMEVGFFLDPIRPSLIPIYIFGAGHVGRAVIDVLAPLQFLISWFDNRPEYKLAHMDAAIMPTIDKVLAEEISRAVSGAYYLVFTHSHALDYELTRAILKRGDAEFCGLIGSQTKRNRFRSRLASDDEITPEKLARLTCPIGIHAIKNKHPQAIAVSVAAQLLQHVEGNIHANA